RSGAAADPAGGRREPAAASADGNRGRAEAAETADADRIPAAARNQGAGRTRVDRSRAADPAAAGNRVAGRKGAGDVQAESDAHRAGRAHSRTVVESLPRTPSSSCSPTAADAE